MRSGEAIFIVSVLAEGLKAKVWQRINVAFPKGL